MTLILNNRDIKALKTIAYYRGANFNNWSVFFRNLNSGFEKTSVAHKLLVNNELNELQSNKFSFENLLNKCDKTEFFLKQYRYICSISLKFFSEHITLPELLLVDTLPGQFSQKPWDSMSVDQKDSEEFKIDKGIYFKKSSLIHPYFEFIIAHELVHWIISHYSVKYYPFTNLVEEGVCDYLSYVILIKSNVVDHVVLTNFLTFLRVLKEPNTIWYNYYRFSKVIKSIVSINGLDYLIGKIKNGREAVNGLSNLNTALTNSLDDEHLNTISNCYDSAESCVVLNANDYHLMKKIVNSKMQVFKYTDVDDDYLTVSDISASLQSLTELSILSVSGTNYFQSFSQLPDNLKFKIEE